MDLKQCILCKKLWPNTLEYYQKDYRQLDGLTKQCKNCRHIIDSHSREKRRLRLRSMRSSPKKKGGLIK